MKIYSTVLDLLSRTILNCGSIANLGDYCRIFCSKLLTSIVFQMLRKKKKPFDSKLRGNEWTATRRLVLLM